MQMALIYQLKDIDELAENTTILLSPGNSQARK